MFSQATVVQVLLVAIYHLKPPIPVTREQSSPCEYMNQRWTGLRLQSSAVVLQCGIGFECRAALLCREAHMCGLQENKDKLVAEKEARLAIGLSAACRAGCMKPCWTWQMGREAHLATAQGLASFQDKWEAAKHELAMDRRAHKAAAEAVDGLQTTLKLVRVI